MNIKDMKRGEWIPGNVKPEAPGVWERENLPDLWVRTVYSLWDGHVWKLACLTPESAAQATLNSRNQNLSWRGQLEYDPNLAPPGFVAELPDPKLLVPCKRCDYWHSAADCDCYAPSAKYPCTCAARPDGREVIMMRAKP